ncbi:RNA-binding (RRM/RBD/RNP motifs) family protein [Citrus sinensis]|nr:RNA-binding (RRM/RBD/RNP motifs) family protein [Citrus sinensis]
MGRSGRKKEKHGKRGEPSLADSNEGSAARTRPFSFDEIMIRRKAKNLSENIKEDAMDISNIPGDCTIENVSDDHKSGRHHGHKKYPGVDVHTSEEYVKVGSGKKEDNALTKNVDSSRQRDGENRDLETKLKEDYVAKSNHRRTLKSEIRLKDRSPGNEKDRGNRGSDTKLKADVTKETSSKPNVKSEKLIPSQGRSHDQSIVDSRDEATKKHSRDLTRKDRHADKSGEKSERESKRKHRNRDDEKNRDKSAAKKVDLGKGHDLKVSERKEKKESPKSRHGNSRLKRRRSRSREREDRNRRSLSLSPRAQKRTSYYDREHEGLPSHSTKISSGRQHSDIDSSRVTSNGLSGHYRRHDGSTSGLGGYSPRKRRTEAAAKTPSPINRSPEKKSAKWDVAPVETYSVPSNVHTSNQAASSNAHEMVSSDPVTSTTQKPLAGISVSASLAKLNVSMDSVQLTQSNRPMRRLCVENLPLSASEKALMEFLNNFLLSSGVQHVHGSLPCIGCVIQREKGQAFVEFLTAEDASAALFCDGRSFSGSILKIKRPKEFVEVAFLRYIVVTIHVAGFQTVALFMQSGEAEKSVASVDSVSGIVKDSPHKIFIGGISRTLSSKMVMEIVCAFGPLKAYHFEVNEDHEEPCAFIEYVDQLVTPKAIAGLNGLKVGGRVLTAVQAVLDGSIMFNPEGFSSLSELEVEEVLEDVRLECARFGSVKSVNVVKYGDSNISTIQACEGNENTASAGVGQNLTNDETNEKGERLEEVTDHKSIKNNELEILNDSKEVMEAGEVNNVKDNRPASGTMGDEPSQLCELDTDMAVEYQARDSTSEIVSQGVPTQVNTLKDSPCAHDDKVTCNIQLEHMSEENKSSAKEDLNLEEVNGNSEAFTGASNEMGMQSSAVENGDNENQDPNQGHIFEPGCVFVEYMRAEASCMAAHSLHRRLFDDRIVAVEYIPLNLYRARFSK